MSKLIEQEVDQFNRDGYLMKPALFDAEEMDLLITIAKNDQRLELLVPQVFVGVFHSAACSN